MIASLQRVFSRWGWDDAAGLEFSATRTRPDLVVCEECDTVHARRPLAGTEVARCVRCGALLGRGQRLAVDAQLALAVAALVIFITGNVSPLVTLDLRGVRSEASLPEAISATWETGQHVVALLAGATAFAFPLALILLRLWVLGPMAAERRAPGFVPAMRALRWVTRWSMVEVFMLGTLIAIVRSAGLATVIPGAGIFSYAALTILLTANQAAGLHGLWRRAAELPT